MSDYIPTDADIAASLAKLPKVESKPISYNQA